jgi:2-polyprenyl-3-methyl-5-hydroxy-6-metoxy-1,4-benzoquinol methylase
MNQADTYEHRACLISGSTSLKKLKGYERSYLVKSPVGFVFCSRIPTEEELVRHYEGYSRNEYVSPVTIKRYNELLDEFEKYKKTGKILDIGCDTGAFLTEAKKRGWIVYGTEYTDKAIEKCTKNGIIMHKGKLDPTWFAKDMFDIVTSFEVIEHINSPVEEVRNICEILRSGGLFYVTTPNFNATERFILKDKYTTIIQYPEHLCYYTKRTLHYLLSNNGFRKLRIVTTGFSLTQIRISLSLSNERQVSPTSSDEMIRTKMEGNLLLRLGKAVTNYLLNAFSLGSSMKAWYIKK